MTNDTTRRTPFDVLREFVRIESAGGIVLVISALVALVWANSAVAPLYFRLLEVPLAIAAGSFGLSKPLLLWINDGLMAIFFLLALAIIDDLGAIVIIALFYTEKLSLAALGLAAMALAGLVALNLRRIERPAAYVLLGVVLWVCGLKSGVHATLAGVAVGFAVPLNTGRGGEDSPLRHLEHALHPWVTFAIMPAFALANAGVALGGALLGATVSPLTLGIALGLFAGKQLGVLGFSWLAVRSGLGEMPRNAGWIQLYGVAILTGVGFTMSLFIGTLAFNDAGVANGVRIGVVAGSLLSALAGYCVLRFAKPDGNR